jgi:hypothetical protein
MNNRLQEWARDYTLTCNTLPKEGTILRAKNGKCKLNMKLTEGENPLVFARAYVNNIVGEKPEWFIANDNRRIGLKIIIMSNARDRLIAKFGIQDVIEVSKLRIIKSSQSSSSLMAEVEEL